MVKMDKKNQVGIEWIGVGIVFVLVLMQKVVWWFLCDKCDLVFKNIEFVICDFSMIEYVEIVWCMVMDSQYNECSVKVKIQNGVMMGGWFLYY